MSIVPDIIDARANLERAIADFEEQLKLFFRTDGQPIYSHAEMAERIEGLLEPVSQAVDAATEVSEEARARARLERLALYDDPMAKLEVTDLAEAILRRTFIIEECEVLPVDNLAFRCQAVNATGNDVAKLLYGRYARRRYEEESKNPGASPGGLEILDAALIDLESHFRPDSQAINQGADTIQEAANDLADYAASSLEEAERSAVASLQNPDI